MRPQLRDASSAPESTAAAPPLLSRAALGVLAAGFFSAALSAPGQTFFVSLYVPEIAAALDVSAVTLASIYGAATLLGAVLLPLAGGWADRLPAHRFLPAVVVGLGMSLLMLASAQGVLMLAVAWTLARCLGQGAVGVGMLAALSRAFEQNRGRALATGTLGHPFGEFVFPGVVAALLAFATWRQSLLVFAALYLLVFPPLLAAGLRAVPPPAREPGTADPAVPNSVTLRDAARTPLFWTATAVLTFAPVVLTALIFHQSAIFEQAGLSRGHVPVALMYFAAAQVAAMMLTGRMVDRGSLRGPLALSCGLLTISTFSLALPAPAGVRVALYGIALGYATGAAAVAGAALWPAYFGIGSVGRIRALTSGIRNAATAAAPLLLALGASRGDFRIVQIVLVALGAGALVLTAMMPAPREQQGSIESPSPEPAADGLSA